MANLTAMRTARGVIKGKVTRFATWLDAFNPQPDDLGTLEARLDEALGLLAEFENIQAKIEDLDSEADHETERRNFEDAYFTTIGKAKMLLRSRANATPISIDSVLTANTNMNSTAIQPAIKLPTMNLPTFNGSYDQWLNFHDAFKTMIHENTALSGIQKFYYLRSSLTDSAAEITQSLVSSEENYTIAWELLTKRFDNKKIMIENHLQALCDIPMMQKDSGTALRQMLDSLQKHTRALKTLGADTWDAMLIHMVNRKMDTWTKREWSTVTKNNQGPTVAELLSFLDDRCIIVGAGTAGKTGQRATATTNSRPSRGAAQGFTGVTTDSISCPMCKDSHQVYKCPVFRNLSVSSRVTEVKKHKLCMNCLRIHSGRCTFGRCRKCNQFHNSLLHEAKGPTGTTNHAPNPNVPGTTQGNNNAANDVNQGAASTSQPSTPTVTLTQCNGTTESQVLLSTALILIHGKDGNVHECRALLDAGSQSNLVTKALADRLSLPRERITMPINGINNTLTNVRQRISMTIGSRVNRYETKNPFLVVDVIVGRYPTTHLNTSGLRIPENLTLADPTFDRPGEIDILIGNGIFWDLLCVGRIKLAKGQPTLQKTHLGWIIAGELTVPAQNNYHAQQFCGLSLQQQIHNNMEQFWKLEECVEKPRFTPEERACDEHYARTHTHMANGRFLVQLPLREDPTQLGESKQIALKRLYAMERKFLRQPELRIQYTEFMDEYETLNHMTKVNDAQPEPQATYYIPHHAVVKEESETTKLRVVFDGSCKTSSNVSLNDILLVGPTIQQDLFSIVLRFRQHTYVISADIEKMYRQIEVGDEHRDLQRILWRRSPDEPVSIFRLNTITYGLACSPFLAIRCLHQLADENYERFPVASRVIKTDFYVDDLLSGADTLDQARRIQTEVSAILGQAEFHLRKWAANEPKLVSGVTRDTAASVRNIGDQVKTLGLLWHPQRDELQYRVRTPDTPHKVTKRIILSTISQIFDPLGLIGPTTIRAKIILQRLWLVKVGWDESVSSDIHALWTQYVGHLLTLENIKIPRLVRTTHPTRIELHGFCDASEAAYGACLYIRSLAACGTWNAQLLCAKSKVAPLKNVSIPRLELCGALLLARLSQKSTRALTMPIDETIYWSDSTITLAWIKGEASQWKTFVANRVTEIREITNPATWRHVRSADNPADIISRGIDPQLLEAADIWWNGPTWLSRGSEHWPQEEPPQALDIPEVKPTKVVLLSVVRDYTIFERFSSLSKLSRVIAYCLRFKSNLLNANNHKSGTLTVSEQDEALKRLIALMQEQEFSDDIKSLTQNRELPRNSKLLPLRPFLDQDGIIRVGGRLENSDLPYTQKHAIVLPAKHRLTRLIIRDEHYRLLHAGPQALLASLRQRYWPLSGRNTIRSVLRHCIVCFRSRPIAMQQLMGNLPAARVTPARAFLKCGVDYAGPFPIKISRNKSGKAYLCLFVCLATRAIHLEIAVDLSTTGFLNAFKRFIARRGRPSDMYSDNGTNFVGANNELKELANLLQNETHNANTADYLSKQSITWHFIPAYSPHFGGLWEAGVKSAKTHLRKVIGTSLLTFEELYTIFTQIESCLNSRPISPMSNDPSDLSPLTPGHFLIGEPLTAIPQSDLLDVPSNRLTRYQHLTQLKQHFWSRWSREYLCQLQQRSKWARMKTGPELHGALVILKDDNVPPMQWRMARIMDTHAGTDGRVRVVSLKTSNGITKRTVTKVCVLPLETDV